jgi:hypothetical protein
MERRELKGTMKCGLKGDREEVIGGPCSEFRVSKNAHLFFRRRNWENENERDVAAILIVEVLHCS